MFETTAQLIKEQLELEEQARDLGIKRYQDERMPWANRDKAGRPEADLPPGLILTKRTVPPMSKAVSSWIAAALDGKGGKHVTAAKFVSQFDPDLVAVLTAKVIINGMARRARLQTIAVNAANCLIYEKDYSAFKEENPAYYIGMLKAIRRSHSAKFKATTMRLAMDRKGTVREVWTLREKVHLGIALVNLFIRSTGAVKIVKTSIGKNKSANFIEPEDEVKEWLNRSHDKCAMLSPLYLPMVVPPRDWVSPLDGGYLSPNLGWLKLIKTHNHNYLEDLSHCDMPKVYRAVNALQATPWRINKRLYAVMRDLWDASMAIGGLPPREAYPMPAVPADMDTNAEAKTEWKRKAAAVHRANGELISKRIEASQKLWIANKFMDYEAIWFPHVLDWRGRAYPVPARVNPQADDTGRALLEFAEGKPLGEDGGYWLAVHIANLFGVDKVSFDDRVQWVADNSEMLCAVAEDPLNDQRWCDADKPFQALAACFEWAGFLQVGEEFISHIPVALDGSNNGLQHLSAMIRDSIGGAQVNLVPSEQPSDIYQVVADIAAKQAERDALEGNEVAARWVGKITRKIAKPGTMTTAYGATLFGMREQIQNLLKQAEAKGEPIVEGDKWEAAIYASAAIHSAIGEGMVAAKQVMDWLKGAAKIVAKDGLPIRWTTPTGFPVLQEYRAPLVKEIWSNMSGTKFRMQIQEAGDKLDTRKQSAGIAPNFVHSLDASHMMETINLCLDNGIDSFAMIHDSYGTHACHAEELGILLREAFVRMYSEDVLGGFRQQLLDQVDDQLASKIEELPPMGTLEISAVLESEYFFA